MSKMKLKLVNLCILIVCFSINGLFGQQVLSGTISDTDNGDLLIGVNILIKGTSTGTITDVDGKYDLNVSEALPYSVVYSLIGYETQEFVITESNANKDLEMRFQSILADEIVVSASRVEEKILESPVTIEKLDLIAIRQSSNADYYDELTKLKGVHTNQASLTFNTINTRGFATAGNTRFVQLMDGMDNAAPLLNFPTGNVVGISELDIKDIELVPGAASALYGPNAFNGILLMNSKNPFDYQGLSASVKGGVTMGDGYTNPLYGASIRFAKAFNNKFAFKFNVSYFEAEDWEANNYTTNNGDPEIKPEDANFNGMNLYGDETFIPVANGIRRTGWKESVLRDNNEAKSIKLSGAFHYKFNEKLEANISYRRGIGSTVYQGSERYALRDLKQEFYKVELNGDNWNVRSYISATDAGDSYNFTALGAFVNESIFPSSYTQNGLPAGWAVAANFAYNNAFETFGFEGLGGTNNLSSAQAAINAKAFADNGGTTFILKVLADSPDIKTQYLNGLSTALGLPIPVVEQLLINSSGNPRPAIGSKELNDYIENVRNGLFQKGGASFIDNSKLYHTEGNYDFTKMFNNVIGLQVGANHRRYSLFTDGTVFNEDPQNTGTNERITIDEYGMYAQVQKRVLNEKLKFTGSLRYDKSENFDGNVTPRISMVYSAGDKRQHNFRASYQTGFRNPTTQGQYIYFPTTSILLGGSKANAERYGIFEGGAYSADSYNAYIGAGGSTDDITGEIDPTDPNFGLLKEVVVNYVKPEKLQSMEVGYKGVLASKLMVDANVYYNIYTDFIDQLNIISKKLTTHKDIPVRAGQAWRPYTNSIADITSLGFGLGMKYRVNSNWNVKASFDYASYEVDEDKLKGTGWEGYKPGFNTPELKFNIGITNRRLVKNLGFGINYRWQSDYDYESTFGSGNVPAYGSLDAQFSYRISSVNSVVKFGATNIIGTNFITNIGNPAIGRMVFVSWTYDQFMK